MSTTSSTPSSRTSDERPARVAGRARTDLMTLGETMLRLSVRHGDRLHDAPAFDVGIGGTEANVAYAAARVGLRSAWASALPDNALGRRVASVLGAGGVDTAQVRWVEGARLGLFFLELGSAPRPGNVIYDRVGSAFAQASPEIFDWEAIADANFLHLSGITLALSRSSFEVGKRAMEEARRRGAAVTFDVNYRQRLWTTAAAAGATRSVAHLVDVLVLTAEDARDLFGSSGAPEAAVAELQAGLGVDTVVLTRGASGATACDGGRIISRPGYAVEAIDRVGAGDAFDAGLIWGLLDGSIELGLERGLAMSALKMTLHGDLFRLDAADVNRLLKRDSREIRR